MSTNPAVGPFPQGHPLQYSHKDRYGIRPDGKLFCHCPQCRTRLAFYLPTNVQVNCPVCDSTLQVGRIYLHKPPLLLRAGTQVKEQPTND